MNCKPGDLAIIRAFVGAPNAGAIVEVLRHCREHPTCWLINSPHRMLAGTNENGNFGYGNFGCINDEKLIPISGVPLTDEQPHDVETPTTA